MKTKLIFRVFAYLINCSRTCQVSNYVEHSVIRNTFQVLLALFVAVDGKVAAITDKVENQNTENQQIKGPNDKKKKKKNQTGRH